MSEPKPLSDDQLANVRDSFEFADRDGNGVIEFKEFASLLRVLSPNASDDQVGAGFSIVDTDSDGQISFDEFVAWWQQVWWEY
ncbi:MAG: EF-hand domain-containing protein [Pseudomonadota bacterium]